MYEGSGKQVAAGQTDYIGDLRGQHDNLVTQISSLSKFQLFLQSLELTVGK